MATAASSSAAPARFVAGAVFSYHRLDSLSFPASLYGFDLHLSDILYAHLLSLFFFSSVFSHLYLCISYFFSFSLFFFLFFFSPALISARADLLLSTLESLSPLRVHHRSSRSVVLLFLSRVFFFFSFLFSFSFFFSFFFLFFFSFLVFLSSFSFLFLLGRFLTSLCFSAEPFLVFSCLLFFSSPQTILCHRSSSSVFLLLFLLSLSLLPLFSFLFSCCIPSFCYSRLSLFLFLFSLRSCRRSARSRSLAVFDRSPCCRLCFLLFLHLFSFFSFLFLFLVSFFSYLRVRCISHCCRCRRAAAVIFRSSLSGAGGVARYALVRAQERRAGSSPARWCCHLLLLFLFTSLSLLAPRRVLSTFIRRVLLDAAVTLFRLPEVAPVLCLFYFLSSFLLSLLAPLISSSLSLLYFSFFSSSSFLLLLLFLLHLFLLSFFLVFLFSYVFRFISSSISFSYFLFSFFSSSFISRPRLAGLHLPVAGLSLPSPLDSTQPT